MTRRKISDDAQDEMEHTLPLHLKYRPVTFKEVRGQDAVIKSLKAAMTVSAKPHAFMFTGPPGLGKTTLARIVGTACNVPPEGVIEFDAASKSGKDDMNQLMSGLRYQGFGASPNKMIIIDECHRLSKEAWDVLLKPIEEPPEHVFFALCTSTPSKVPEAQLTRVLRYALKPCTDKVIEDLIFDVVDLEGYKTSDGVLIACVDAANGSPRQALVNLAKVHACDDVDEARELLEAVDIEKEIIDLCRLLIAKKLTWRTLRETLKTMKSPDAESIRIMISCYLAGCVMGARDDRDIGDLCGIAYRFSKPFNATDKLMPLFLAFDELMGK